MRQPSFRNFSIGSAGKAFHFVERNNGWVQAVTRSDGTTPVIGGQFDLHQPVQVPQDWSEVDESTGFNAKISEGDDFYPGAGFDTTLIRGQLADALWALETAQQSSDGRLLELGCGPGFLLNALSEALESWTVEGVDPSPESVSQARSRGLNVKLGFVESAEITGPYDAIVVMGNFQLHVDPSATLRSLADICRPGAELFVDMKNPRSSARRIARQAANLPGLKRSRRVQSFAAHAWHGIRHGIPRGAVEQMLNDSGWELVELRTVAPRLLRFQNSHSFAGGPAKTAWRALDRLDGAMDERAWIQVSARRSR